MFRYLRFFKSDEETVILQVPKGLKGKLVEIVLSEKVPDSETNMDEDAGEQMAHKEIELQMLDKMRNQLIVWDI